MKIEIGNLISTLETDNPEILRALRAKYSYHVPGYQYSSAYKSRRWDGKKSYFKDNGRFRTGLLGRILKDLEKIGCTNPEYGGKILYPKLQVSKIKKFKYRDYQEEAIQHCLDVGRCLVESPTGSGKTLIMAGVIKSIMDSNDNKITAVILFKEKGILKQTYEFFKNCGIKNLGINFGEGHIDGRIMLSTVQSIDKILDTHLDSCDLLMVDEVHQFGVGETTIAAIESFPKALYRYGFTATLPKEKADSIHARLTLEGAFGSVYSTVSMTDLVEQGSLAKPIIQIIENPEEEQPGPNLSYQEVYEKYIVRSDIRNGIIADIVSAIYKKYNDAKILILTKNLEHVRILNELIPNSFVIEGITSIEDRYLIIDKFINSGDSSTIIGTNVMQTGISIDDITHMINARGLKGEIPTIQGLGRGVRKSKKTDKLYFYDFIDNFKYLSKHSKERIKHYKDLGLEINHVKNS